MILIIIIFFVCLLLYVIARVTCGQCHSKVCLIGKTAIITGGNAGIGYETAVDLASRGCKVIIADKADATKTINKLITDTNNPNIIAKYLDLASFKSIRQFATQIIENEDRLDILINNAGTATSKFKCTEDGLQTTMQVNYFGPFLLTTLLIDLLKKSAPSRIIFLSSSLIFDNDLTLQNLNPSSSYKDSTIFRTGFYSNSKLCTLIASNEFSEKLKKFHVTSNSLHPGSARTDIFRVAYEDDGCFKHLLATLILYFFGKTPREGAQTSIHLAVSNKMKNVTGKYFWDCNEFLVPYKAKDKEFRKQIWNLTEKYVQLEEHEKII